MAVYNLKPMLFLLVFPILRGIIYGGKAFLTGAYYDFLILLALIGLSIIKWHRSSYTVSSQLTTFHSSFILQKKIRINNSSIALAKLRRPFWMRPFRACTVELYTDSKMKKPEFSVQMSYFEAQRFVCVAMPYERKGRSYKANGMHRLLMPFLAANCIAGVIACYIGIANSKKILGTSFLEDAFVERLLETINIVGTVAPPIIAFAISLVFLGFAVSMLVNIERTFGFSVRRRGSVTTLNMGLVSKNLFYFNTDAINAIDTKRSISGIVFRNYPIYCSISGFDSADSPPIMIVSDKSGTAIQETLFSEFSFMLPQIVPNKKTMRSYIVFPLIASTVFAVLALTLLRYYTALFVSAGILCGIFLWWTAMRIYAQGKVGFSVNNGNLSVYHMKKFAVHNAAIPLDRIDYVTVRRLPHQYISKTCHIIIKTRGHAKKRSIFAFYYADALAFSEYLKECIIKAREEKGEENA